MKELFFSNSFLRFHSSQNTQHSKLIVNFILRCIETNGIQNKSEWVRPSPNVNVKVGIGEYKGNKAIQTYSHHVEIVNEDLGEVKCFDRNNRTDTGAYTLITDETKKSQVLAGLAEMIQDIKMNNTVHK